MLNPRPNSQPDINHITSPAHRVTRNIGCLFSLTCVFCYIGTWQAMVFNYKFLSSNVNWSTDVFLFVEHPAANSHLHQGILFKGDDIEFSIFISIITLMGFIIYVLSFLLLTLLKFFYYLCVYDRYF